MGVTILEATSEAQEILVNSALEAVEDEYDGDGDGRRGIRDFEQDPYGVVLWPSAKLVGNVLLERFSSAELQALTILELGTGTGLVSLVAARAGCKKVIATDFNPLTLSIVKRAAVVNGIPEGCITTQLFDVKAHSTQPLPACDLLLVADMLYEPATAVAVARRVAEVVRMNDDGGPGVRVIVGDSPNRPGRSHFVSALKELLPERAGEIEFVKIAGESVVGVRNDLISDKRSVTKQPRALEMGLLEL
jgi:predicted nicotinamide N-methyase